MPRFGKDELFQLQFDPGKPEGPAGGMGQIGGEAFQQFAWNPAGFGRKNPAQGMVVDSFTEVVRGGGLGE
jgi:hypothetical protein